MIAKAIAFVAFAAVGFSAWHYTHRPIVETFQTEPVSRGSISSTVSATGTLNSTATAQVGAQVSGMIKAIYVDYNSPVHKGQVLALIDPSPFEAKLKQSQANLNSDHAAADAARSSLAEAREAVHVAEQQSASQQKLAEVARSAEELSKVELDRSAASADAGIINQDEYLTAKATYTVTDDDRQAAEAQAKGAALSIPEKQAEVESAQATLDAANEQVKQSEASVEVDRANLAHTEIISPVDGFVLDRLVSPGETVASSAVVPVLFSLVKSLNTMQVDVNLDESDVSRVQIGQDATFTVDAFPNRTFQATVRQVREEATNIQNVISYDVVLDVLTKGVALLPGMTANVQITTATRSNAIKVPNSALRFRPENAPPVDKSRSVNDGTVYALKNGVPVENHVVTGIANGRETEIVSDNLQAGDLLVVSSSRHH